MLRLRFDSPRYVWVTPSGGGTAMQECGQAQGVLEQGDAVGTGRTIISECGPKASMDQHWAWMGRPPNRAYSLGARGRGVNLGMQCQGARIDFVRHPAQLTCAQGCKRLNCLTRGYETVRKGKPDGERSA